MIRLFTAIKVPESIKSHARSICNGVEGAKWNDPSSMHITLNFIGMVKEEMENEIISALSNVKFMPFSLHLSGVDHFKHGHFPTVLWAGISKSEELMDLQKQTDRAIRSIGLNPDSRKYAPHLTLARLMNIEFEQIIPFMQRHALFKSEDFEVDDFHLFLSTMGRNGPIHREIW